MLRKKQIVSVYDKYLHTSYILKKLWCLTIIDNMLYIFCIEAQDQNNF